MRINRIGIVAVLAAMLVLTVLPLQSFGQNTTPTPSTWGSIKAMYGSSQAGVVPDGSSDVGPVIPADQINALGQVEADRVWKSGRNFHTNGGWVLYINVPFYSQRDGAWSSQLLGYGGCGSSDNIYNYGCHLCCISMLYAKWGYPEMNPPGLNNWSYGGRVHYAFDAPAASNKYCGDLIRMTQALQYPMICRSWRYISVSELWSQIAAGHPVVAKLYAGNNAFHFVLIFGYRDGRYYVKDPWKDAANQDQPLGNVADLRVYGY